MKLAFMVIGPESTGTRNLTQILVDSGFVGDSGHVQNWDASPPIDQSPIVWRRSIPHGFSMPDLSGMVSYLEGRDYRVVWLICCREPMALSSSQVCNFEALPTVESSLDRISSAYRYIFKELEKKSPSDFYVVPYEGIVSAPNQVIGFVLSRYGINTKVQARVRNENLKHYRGPK